MMSKTELNMEAIKAAGGHDKWLKTLDSNLRQMRKASVLYQDKMAIERYAKSIEGATPDPLEIDSYVIKVARPPQQEVKLHLKYTGHRTQARPGSTADLNAFEALVRLHF